MIKLWQPAGMICSTSLHEVVSAPSSVRSALGHSSVIYWSSTNRGSTGNIHCQLQGLVISHIPAVYILMFRQ